MEEAVERKIKEMLTTHPEEKVNENKIRQAEKDRVAEEIDKCLKLKYDRLREAANSKQRMQGRNEFEIAALCE